MKKPEEEAIDNSGEEHHSSGDATFDSTSKRLSELQNPPDEIFQRGTVIDEINLNASVAIVGSRKASKEGCAAAYELGGRMARENRVVISGLALGIDTAAFQGALDAEGICIAVLPSGIDIITPPSNEALANRILDFGGALVSEYPEGMHPMRHTFVHRNRIIAAIADTTILGESAPKGGAWHTVRAAWALGREVLILDSDGALSPLPDPQEKLF